MVHPGRPGDLGNCAQHNGWWGGYRPKGRMDASLQGANRPVAGTIPTGLGPSFTEDLDQLNRCNGSLSATPGSSTTMGSGTIAGATITTHRSAPIIGFNCPYLEQPWARSGQGKAWDGLSKYDLTRFNPWYFSRLKQFAGLCQDKSAILFHNFYMQHASAWRRRPTTLISHGDRPTASRKPVMPDTIPAANAFYDLTNEERRELHRLYIRQCLDELGDQTNVIHLVSEEYTGPLSFMQFWIDTILQWERDTGKHVKIGLVGTKDVIDAVLADPVRGPRVCLICLSYWWYTADGTLYAPAGGREVPGRYTGQLAKATKSSFVVSSNP